MPAPSRRPGRPRPRPAPRRKFTARRRLAAGAVTLLLAAVWAAWWLGATQSGAESPERAVARLADASDAAPVAALRQTPFTAGQIAAVLQTLPLNPALAAQFPLPQWTEPTRRAASDALGDVFTFQGVRAKVPRLPGGGLDWNWRGPNDDPEFAWFLNRLEQVPLFFVAWRETGDARYRRALNDTLADWLTQNPRPRRYSLSSAWRPLEAARRVEDSWLPVLFAPGAAAALDEATRVRMLASLVDHAECLRDTHTPFGNHLISEISALASVALVLPQLRDAPAWLQYALDTTRAELTRQFYPDGAHQELSNLYQLVVLQDLQHLDDLLAAAGREGAFPELHPLLENAWNYYAYVMDPRGEGPLDNDSDIGYNYIWLRPLAASYGRADWLHLITGGRAGTQPAGSPTRYFPWAGRAVMRGGWGPDDQWAFFDFGPRGSDHQHDDFLQLSITAGHRDLLVGNGRYNYQPGPWRDYFTGPRAHNLVLLDGQGALRPPDVAAAPAQVRNVITPGWDFFAATAAFSGAFATGQGPAYATRSILYVHQEYWIVVDRVLCAGGPRHLDVLWHFHPDCAVRRDGDLLYTADQGATNLGLLAVNPPRDAALELIRGRDGPQPQGWYSPAFDVKLPATCADFSTTLAAPRSLVWILWTAPANHAITATRPQVQIVADNPARLQLNLRWPDGRVDAATVPFADADNPAWQRNRAVP